eukprot:GFYU01001681.1.p1 GENE.GFYU01001681.1~~GFYU01001681.1.p1  ORF type:complete len:421 (-),score=78.34 GFYU01001681.1:374-1537(-)
MAYTQGWVNRDGSVTEVQHQSYGSRVGNSFCAAGFGIILFLLSFPLLFWNEKRDLLASEMYDFAENRVIAISPHTVEKEHERKLVYVAGQAELGTPFLRDEEFNLSVDGAIALKRNVEVFQWKEHKHTSSSGSKGSKTTHYTYSPEWSSSHVNSHHFKNPDHVNPSRWRVESKTKKTNSISIGTYSLASEYISQLAQKTSRMDVDRKRLPGVDQDGWTYHGGCLVDSRQPSHPIVGDHRVCFDVSKHEKVSVMGRREGVSIIPYKTPNGDIKLSSPGMTSPSKMVASARSEESLMTWGLRGAGFLMMWLGLVMVMSPLTTTVEIIPLLGDMINLGVGVSTFLVAAVCTLTTVAVSWMYNRPMIALGIAMFAGLVMMGSVRLGKQKKQ